MLILQEFYAQMKVCLTEALKTSQEDRHLVVNLETARWELADAEMEMKWLKSAMTSEKEYEQVQKKVDEFKLKLEKERLVILSTALHINDGLSSSWFYITLPVVIVYIS